MTKKQMSAYEMITEYFDEDLMNKIGNLLNEAKVSVSTVEVTLAVMLADSLGQFSESVEEVNINANAYAAFIHRGALDAFEEKN